MWSILLLFVAVSWFAVVVERRLQARKQKQTEERERTLQQFRTWSSAALAGDRALQEWLAALSDDALLALAKSLAHYCHDFGFQFDWLAEGKAASMPALAARMQKLAAQYVEACHEAHRLQGDIRSFEAALSPP